MEAWEDAGQPIPDELFMPEVLDGYGDWLDAFWELSTDRRDGGPIPGSAVTTWVSGWPLGEANTFRRVIRFLDNEYMAFQRRKRGAPPAPAPQPGQKRSPATEAPEVDKKHVFTLDMLDRVGR